MTCVYAYLFKEESAGPRATATLFRGDPDGARARFDELRSYGFGRLASEAGFVYGDGSLIEVLLEDEERILEAFEAPKGVR